MMAANQTRVSRKRTILSAVSAGVAGAIAFAWGQTDVAIASIQFDLRKIGESVYEAHSRSRRWPEQVADLEGTAYLQMPYRRGLLEAGHFVVVWQQDLDANPEANRERILAYDNGSLFAKLGWVWVCRGDLRLERMGRGEVRAKTGSGGRP